MMANWLPQSSLDELLSLVDPFSHGCLGEHASMISCHASPVAHLIDRRMHTTNQICMDADANAGVHAVVRKTHNRNKEAHIHTYWNACMCACMHSRIKAWSEAHTCTLLQRQKERDADVRLCSYYIWAYKIWLCISTYIYMIFIHSVLSSSAYQVSKYTVILNGDSVLLYIPCRGVSRIRKDRHFLNLRRINLVSC